MFTLQGVTLSVALDRDFVTPNFQKLIDFYPEYRKQVMGETPYSFQAYFLAICKELEKRKCREGRTAEDWGRRYFEHFGYREFAGLCGHDV